jgi:hypothetical protein
MKILKALRKREKAAYPSFMRQMQRIKTWSDLQEYCESDQVVVHFLGDKGYLILTESEVVDWVGDGQHSLKAFGIIKKAFGDRPFNVDLRKSSSWPIMKVMERRGRINMKKVSSWEWGDETMYEAIITIK